MGKLKKFLTQARFVMQDSLLYMTVDSVKRFVTAICDFVPIDVKVYNSNKVENTYYSPEEIERMGAPRDKLPLFHIDLLVGADGLPTYSTSASEVVSTILAIFDAGIKSLQEINQVEQKLLPHLFKSNAKMFLKSTHRPDYRPEEPNPEDKRELPDENTWVFDEFDKLRDCVTKIIDPMKEYKKQYDQYDKEYKFDPDKEMAQYDDPENWPDVDTLRGQILFHQSEEKRLNNEIPEEMVCSIFLVSTKVIRDMLALKHRKIANEQIELIAKIAKQQSATIQENFEQYSVKVESIPKDIEQLSDIKDFMNGLPNELDKQQNVIKQCMQIYDCLSFFHHKFEDEEEYDKMWNVFGAPKETMERIEKQQGFLDKEKEKFIKQMDNNKGDFSS
jgi:dynein heavy chain, axonemal